MIQDRKRQGSSVPIQKEDVDTNFTYFDLALEHVDVTLSLWKWLEGQGLIKDFSLKGVRGSVGESVKLFPFLFSYEYNQTGTGKTQVLDTSTFWLTL